MATWLAKKGIICVSTKCWGSYDVTRSMAATLTTLYC